MKMWKSFFLALKIAEQNNLSPKQCGNVNGWWPNLHPMVCSGNVFDTNRSKVCSSFDILNFLHLLLI